MKTFFILFIGILRLLLQIFSLLVFTAFEIWVIWEVGELLITKYNTVIGGYLFWLAGGIIILVTWAKFFTNFVIDKIVSFFRYFFM